MFKKIEIPALAIRFLTLTCYFLPFVFFFSTCVDGISKSAYNKEQAIANEREKIEFEKKDLLDKAVDLVSDKLNVTDSSAELSSETIKLLERAGDDWYLQPTYTSLSALGVVLQFKNTAAQVLVVLSFLISVLTFIFWRLMRNRVRLCFIGANLLFVIAFIGICFFENVTVLYGLWGLLFLLAVQFLTEVQAAKKINHTLGDINPN